MKFRVGDKLILKTQALFAAKKGFARATVISEEKYNAICQEPLVGIVWDRDGYDHGQSDGEYRPADFGLWKPSKDDARAIYSEILEAQEIFERLSQKV